MNPRILLVEDQLLMQQVELALLAKAGYQAEVAASGQEAFDKSLPVAEVAVAGRRALA